MNSLKKAEKFVWTEDMEKDFLELKAEFSAGRIQAYPDFDSDPNHGLVVFEYCRGLISEAGGSREIPGLLGVEV